MCTPARMNMFMIVLGVAITAILMVSANGLCAIIAMALHFLVKNHPGQASPRTSRQPLSDPNPGMSGSNLVAPATAAFGVHFRRPCVTFEDCRFESDAREMLLLSCRDMAGYKLKFCSCEHHWGLVRSRAVNEWKLNWNAKKGVCSISNLGPCGWNRGLQIVCSEGLTCTVGRCRETESVGKGPVGHPCAEDSDCEPSLECGVSAKLGPKNYAETSKKCLPRHRAGGVRL